MNIKTLKIYLQISSMLEIQPTFKGLNNWNRLVKKFGNNELQI